MVHGENVDMVGYMIDLDPLCVNDCDERYDVPLGYACDYGVDHVNVNGGVNGDGNEEAFDEEREVNRLNIVQ